MIRPAILAALVVAAGTATAQTPADRWLTIDLPHFRVHYPKQYEAWTMRAAATLEPIRTAVANETGFAAPQITDVLVVNPQADANGLTYPLLDTPRIVLYAEPPEPDDQLGEFSSWTDLLTTHEMTHLEHLLRPSRNPVQQLLEQVLPVGPIALSAPRWVDEGYATVIEGRLTGSGRPSSSIRAAILRKWAASGRLPTYAQLSSDHRFLGMSMAYLAGSAYLEWLEARTGEGSLRRLWARMTARQRRSFGEAFAGVFGDSPERLYGLFTAELTERAVSVEGEGSKELHEGTLWQETTNRSGDPAISPDGSQLAVVLRNRQGEAKLVVLPTAAPAGEETKREKRIARMLARDPQDVAPVESKPQPHKPSHTLRLPLGGDISTPRWFPGGDAILFTHRARDRAGDRHHDLYRWELASGRVTRLTRWADVKDADPLPDGSTAVAVRSRFGLTQLVRVALGDGTVSPITEASIDEIASHPRYRDGHVAYAVHRGPRWQIVDRELASSRETVLDLAGNAADPEWGAGGELYASVFSGGFVELYRTSGGAGTQITRMSGGAFQPAPSPDGRIFFMALEPDGFAIHALAQPEAVAARTAAPRPLVPALPPIAAQPVVFRAETLPPTHDYGIGHQEPSILFGGNDSPEWHELDAGVRIGDVVGRLDAVALVAFGGVRGGSLSVLWRGLPVELRAQAFAARLHQHSSDALREHGLELRAISTSHFETSSLTVEAGGLARNNASLAFAGVAANARQLHAGESVALSAEAGQVRHERARARLETALGVFRLGAEGQRDWSSGEGKTPFDRISVGGSTPSILPRSAFASQVIDPALEPSSLTGRSYRGWQIDAGSGIVTLFHREHEMGSRIRVDGAELRFRMAAMPIVRLPAISLTAGAARAAGRNRGWIGLRYEP